MCLNIFALKTTTKQPPIQRCKQAKNKMQPTNPNAHVYVNGTDGGLSSVKYDV